ncbi:Rib/alpha-like domain-containing protein [Arcanobacterium pinnipediorum]|uniref:Rib/alpha-like domain-containing protein n=1 Tax=Arcanobacterium pinnipediorum TaxID=1503041 RepID=A0ABY5AGB1_9ACTO|nr:Rib/alpha-like domain-containing protein [Arcanobacterium pinnipediorum]USR79233.1 Rib/alpha-like domain-containing protein [Arcanobacterium pinnipediorum]
MRIKKIIISPILAAGLVIGFAPSALAAEEFAVTATTTLDELKVALADETTQRVIFTENANFDGGIVINHPMTFVVNDGIAVNFTTGVGHALDIKSEFVFNNMGTVNLVSSGGYGVKINQKTPGQSVVFMGDGRDGSAINVGPTKNYGIDGQLLNGPFTVKDMALNVATGPDTVEGPMIFAKQTGESVDAKVVFDNVALNLDHSSTTSVWRPALYSEREITFRNSAVRSQTVRNYNMSFVAGAPATFDNSTVDLVTTADAVTEGFWIFKKPFVAINTAGNTVNILNSTISSDIQATGATHEAFQFQDSTYNIDSSVVVGDSLGVDSKQTAGSHLKITGDSKVQIPGTSDMPNAKITTVIDGGTVVLPPTTVAKNSIGQDLREFISDADTTEVSIDLEGNPYTYKVTKESDDSMKHVWAPAVMVDYYVNQDDAQSADTRTLIAGTNIAEPLNATTFFTQPDVPAGFAGKFVIFDPTPGPEFTSMSTVSQDTKITFTTTPLPDVETVDITVMVGDPVGATDGIVDLPKDASVEIITPADVSVPGKTTQTVKITFGDGSMVTKIINVTVIERKVPDPTPTDPTPTDPTPTDPTPTDPTPMPTDKPLAQTGASISVAGWIAAILLAGGAGIIFAIKNRQRS